MTNNNYFGILNIKKETGYTSFHVIAVLRHILGIKKIGHTGTLDPDASGVLPVCLGKATKILPYLENTDKEYHAVMKLGIRTDTQDISGSVLSDMSPGDIRAKNLSREDFVKAAENFTGEILQVPPMYSALKVNGEKLVDAARKGKTIERKPRKVTVHYIKDIRFFEDDLEVSFVCGCSKGTYIRTLCEDMGESLQIPACLKSLERTMACGLCIDDSITVDEAAVLYGECRLDDKIIPADSFLAMYPALTVRESSLKKLLAGNPLDPEELCGMQTDLSPPADSDFDDIVRIYDAAGNFRALYHFDKGSSLYKCERMFG